MPRGESQRFGTVLTQARAMKNIQPCPYVCPEIMTQDQLVASLRTDPYAFAQYMVDAYYPQVLNRAQADKIVQGDVGTEGLYTAIANLIQSGNMVAVSRLVNIQPSEQDAVIQQLTQIVPPHGPRAGYRSTGSDWWNENGDMVGDIAGTIGNLFGTIWTTTQTPDQPNAAPQPAPLPPAQSGGMGSISTNTILIAVAVVAAVVIGVVALRK